MGHEIVESDCRCVRLEADNAADQAIGEADFAAVGGNRNFGGEGARVDQPVTGLRGTTTRKIDQENQEQDQAKAGQLACLRLGEHRSHLIRSFGANVILASN